MITNNSEYLSFYKKTFGNYAESYQGKTVNESNNKLCDSLGE